MYFRVIDDARSSAIGYLLADPAAQQAVVVDPPPGQEALIRALLDERGLHLQCVVRTHVHRPDHADPGGLCAHSGACCVVGEGAESGSAVQRVRHDDSLVFGDEVLHVLSTPGHTPHCVSYLWRDRLFCGDVFDVGGCAVGDSESDPALLYDTLTQRVFLLPGETLVFPSHRLKGRTVSTVAEERRRHAQLTGRSRESFVTEMGFRRLVRPHLARALERPAEG